MALSRRLRAWRALPKDERTRVAVVVVASLVAACAALLAAPGAFRVLEDARDEAAALSPEQREIGALYADVDTEFLLAARRLLPEDARFAVVVGRDVRFANPVLVEAAPDFTRYFLLPRRQVAPAQADWLLCYGCERVRGRTVDVLWAKEGMVIGRLRA